MPRAVHYVRKSKVRANAAQLQRREALHLIAHASSGAAHSWAVIQHAIACGGGCSEPPCACGAHASSFASTQAGDAGRRWTFRLWLSEAGRPLGTPSLDAEGAAAPRVPSAAAPLLTASPSRGRKNAAAVAAWRPRTALVLTVLEDDASDVLFCCEQVDDGAAVRHTRLGLLQPPHSGWIERDGARGILLSRAAQEFLEERPLVARAAASLCEACTCLAGVPRYLDALNYARNAAEVTALSLSGSTEPGAAVEEYDARVRMARLAAPVCECAGGIGALAAASARRSGACPLSGLPCSDGVHPAWRLAVAWLRRATSFRGEASREEADDDDDENALGASVECIAPAAPAAGGC